MIITAIRILTVVSTIFIASCDSKEIYRSSLTSIEALSILPSETAHNLKMKIKGKVNCPITLTLLMDEKPMKPGFLLKGLIDTTYSTDWYQNRLGFSIEGKNCIEEGQVVISIYN